MILDSLNSEGFFFNNAGTNAFKLDHVNATFAGGITFNGTLNSTGNLILSTASAGANIELYTNGQAYYDAVSHNFRDSDASPTYFQITASQVNSFIKLSMASNKIIDLATPTLSTDAVNKAYVDSSAGNPSHFRQGFKTQTVGTAFSTVLTVNLSNHTGCYVTVCCFGDWSAHSSAAYRGEFFLQNGANAYAEPGIIIRQDDNTSDAGDQIICQIVDNPSTANPKDFVIQIKHTDTSGSFNGTVTFTVQGQFNSVT